MAHTYVLTFKLKNVTDILFFIFMSHFTRLPRGVINSGALGEKS